MAKSKHFRWIEVDRDRAPALPKAFRVQAYPTLIVIGPKREKIHRFQSFMPAKELVEHLDEGLRRFALYRAGRPWDPRPPRAATICDGRTIETLRTPTDDRVAGMTMSGGKLWIIQGKRIHRVDPHTGKSEVDYAIAGLPCGVCSDGTSLFVLDYGWTMGKPIRVIDRDTGKVVREIVTEANKKNRYSAASGIAFAAGQLWVLSRSEHLSEIDPRTGTVLRDCKLPQKSWKLAFDGTHWITTSLVSAKRQELRWLDPKKLEVVRRLDLNYAISAVAVDGADLLLTEQPVMGFDTQHRHVRLYPDRMRVHKVRRVRDGLDGRRRSPGTERESGRR
ncbi:MAG: hypothetical protein H6836_09275 [Planctomycetes bacterium]|nr:hypothetical protein [Planctomycetota bacterium]